MLPINKTVQAEEDLINIWLNISNYSVPAADSLLDRFEKFFSTLSEQPKMGKIVNGLEKQWPDKIMRFFPVDDYLIFYYINTKSIHIVRVFHSALDYARVFQSH